MSYTTKDIITKTDRDHIRHRTGMYLGKESPKTVAFREIIDNATDEVAAHYGNHVTITLHPDNSFEVEDNGRGLPIDYDTAEHKNGIVKTIGTARSGGKFNDTTGIKSAGLNGIGASACNFISSRFDVTVYRDGKQYTQQFHEGIPGHFAGKNFDPNATFTPQPDAQLTGTKTTHKENGTRIRFLFDPTVAAGTDIRVDDILFRAQCTARIVDNLHLTIINNSTTNYPEHLTADYTGTAGADTLLDYLYTHQGNTLDTDPTVFDGSTTFTLGSEGDTTVTYAVAMAPAEGESQHWGFFNAIYTPDGGAHTTGMLKGVGGALADRASLLRGLKMSRGEQPPENDDFTGTLSMCIVAWAQGDLFSSQSKTKVDSTTLRNALVKDITSKVGGWANSPGNIDQVRKLSESALEFARARRSVESAKKRARSKNKARSLGENLSLPGKLVPSRFTGRGSGAELFLAEGDSALGSIKAARNSDYQAAFPLRGKPLNAYRLAVSKARKNKEFVAIETLLGCGVGEKCDPEKCRYDRIMLCADADADGLGIQSLLIAMFYTHFRPLLEEGMVFITQPPLFVVSKGSTRLYALDEEQRDDCVHRLEGVKGRLQVIRCKGLGEMNAEDMWETTMNPEDRVLMQVSVADAEATVGALDVLFAGEAEGRREWIEGVTAVQDLSELDIDD